MLGSLSQIHSLVLHLYDCWKGDENFLGSRSPSLQAAFLPERKYQPQNYYQNLTDGLKLLHDYRVHCRRKEMEWEVHNEEQQDRENYRIDLKDWKKEIEWGMNELEVHTEELGDGNEEVEDCRMLLERNVEEQEYHKKEPEELVNDTEEASMPLEDGLSNGRKEQGVNMKAVGKAGVGHLSRMGQ